MSGAGENLASYKVFERCQRHPGQLEFDIALLTRQTLDSEQLVQLCWAEFGADRLGN